MTTGCVLDVLIYVYDHYMISDPSDIPGRAQMFSELAREGFTLGEVVQAMEWLSVLAAGTPRPPPGERRPTEPALRIYSEGELGRLPVECRSLLTRLDRDGVLTPEQRELVIERTLALDVEEPTLEQLRWVVLLALSIQPGQEAAVARFQALMAGSRPTAWH